MSRRVRLLVFLVGGGAVAVMFALAFLSMPHFGRPEHLYRDLAVPAAVRHATANVVSSVNFDQRAIDTFGEETILIASVVGTAALLRPAKEETERRVPDTGRTLGATRLVGYLLLPVSLVIGLDVVVHGQLTPGGGFQGGAVLATGLHLLYVSGSYPALDRLRPLELFDIADALGATTFAAVGLAGIAIAGSFLSNMVSFGTFGALFSAGTVPILNVAVGLEVFVGIVAILAKFLEQDITVVKEGDDG
ncbi:MAG TPA: MnhB domain-containing protein [Nocardioidaceae bacterium]|nr:MnhB domain-containing protein [Nocardioidaceae bacterium]